MGIEDKLRETAKGLGKKVADMAKEDGNQLLGDLKGKFADEVEGLKHKATAATDLVEEQKNKLTEKATDMLKKR
jgi:hypothetical protein